MYVRCYTVKQTFRQVGKSKMKQTVRQTDKKEIRQANRKERQIRS